MPKKMSPALRSVLKAARKWLADEEHWCKHDELRVVEPDECFEVDTQKFTVAQREPQVQTCAIGAAGWAASQKKLKDPAAYRNKAETILSRAAAKLYPKYSGIVDFNDGPAEHEDILKVYDYAIKNL